MMKNLLILFLLLLVSFATYGQQADKSLNTESINTISNISAYPNPFKDKTLITFRSSAVQNVYFEVKNILGKQIYTLHLVAKKGINEILFTKNNLEKGMYIYTIQADSEVISKRLVVR
jgi:hypothetical protein